MRYFSFALGALVCGLIAGAANADPARDSAACFADCRQRFENYLNYCEEYHTTFGIPTLVSYRWCIADARRADELCQAGCKNSNKEGGEDDAKSN